MFFDLALVILPQVVVGKRPRVRTIIRTHAERNMAQQAGDTGTNHAHAQHPVYPYSPQVDDAAIEDFINEYVKDATSPSEGGVPANARIENPYSKAKPDEYYAAIRHPDYEGHFIPFENMSIPQGLMSYFVAAGTTIDPATSQHFSAKTIWNAYYGHLDKDEPRPSLHAYQRAITAVATRCEEFHNWPSPDKMRFSSKNNCVTVPIAIMRRIHGDEAIVSKSIDWRDFGSLFERGVVSETLTFAKSLWEACKGETYLETHRNFHGLMVALGHQPGSEKARTGPEGKKRWAYRLTDLWDPVDYYTGEGNYTKWGKYFLKDSTKKNVMEEEREVFEKTVVQTTIERVRKITEWPVLATSKSRASAGASHDTKEDWMIVAEQSWKELVCLLDMLTTRDRRMKAFEKAPRIVQKRKLQRAIEADPPPSPATCDKKSCTRFVEVCAHMAEEVDAPTPAGVEEDPRSVDEMPRVQDQPEHHASLPNEDEYQEVYAELVDEDTLLPPEDNEVSLLDLADDFVHEPLTEEEKRIEDGLIFDCMSSQTLLDWMTS